MSASSPWVALVVSFLLALTLATSHALLRSAAILKGSAWDAQHLWRIGIALSLYGVVFASYTYLLRWFELSLLYPLYTGLSVVLVFLAGIWIFSETLTVSKGVGVLLVIAGVWLMSARG